MPHRKSPVVITLEESERLELERLVRRPTAPSGMVRRARIILLLASGHSVSETARAVGVQRRIVRQWARRFQQERIAGLPDRPRPGRPPVFSPRGGRPRGEAGLPDA